MKKLRIAALGDLHVHDAVPDTYISLFEEISQKADILVRCGDLTDRGTIHEAELLAQQLSPLKLPAVGILGNHDHESGFAMQVKDVLKNAKMAFLDDEAYVFQNVGFAGTKGFMGGFERYMLGPFGEDPIKKIVDEAVKESLVLETSLNNLHTRKKVVALHYAPIRQTVEGEPLEIFSFLGSSRLVDPIDNYDVTAVFHGHAHYGSPLGKTLKGIPVYNVASPLMIKHFPKKPYALVEV